MGGCGLAHHAERTPMIKMGARGPWGGLIRAVWPLAGPMIHMDGVIPYVVLIHIGWGESTVYYESVPQHSPVGARTAMVYYCTVMLTS